MTVHTVWMIRSCSQVCAKTSTSRWCEGKVIHRDPQSCSSQIWVKVVCKIRPLLSFLAFNFLPEHWGLTADRRHNNKAHISDTNSNFCWLEAGCYCKWVNTHTGGCIKLSDICPNILCFNLDLSCLSPLPNKWVS